MLRRVSCLALQRGGEPRQVFDMLTPGKAKRSAAVALPSPAASSRHGSATPRSMQNDSEFNRRLDSTTPSHRAKKSKIPGFHGNTPNGSRLGLADRTNLD